MIGNCELQLINHDSGTVCNCVLKESFAIELKVARVQKICILLQPIMTGQLNKHITAMASEYDRVRECDCYKRQAGMSTSSITPPTPCTPS